MMHKTLIVFTFLTLFTDSMANTVSWDFPSFDGSYMDKIALLGDSSQNDGWVMLTEGDDPNNPQINWSAGALVSRDAVSFSTAFSFSTTFSFSITTNNNPTSFGQGLAFFISPLGLSAGLANPFGLPNNFVAVVFDTHASANPTVDPENSRIIVLANNVEPIAETSSIGHDLTSGKLLTAWIDYYRGNLTVFLGQDRFKPEIFLLTVQIDFLSYLINNTDVYIGFSALSIGRIERHFMKSWSFQSKNDFDSENSSHKKLIGGIVFVVVFVIVAFLILIYLKVRTTTRTQYPLAEQEQVGVGDIELASSGQEAIPDDSQVSQGHEQGTWQEGGHFVSQSESEIVQEDDNLPSSSQSVTTPNVGIEAAEESTPKVSKRLRFFPKKFDGFQLFKP